MAVTESEVILDTGEVEEETLQQTSEAGIGEDLDKSQNGVKEKPAAKESDEEGEASDDGELDPGGENGEAEEGELEDGEVDDDEDGGQQSKSSVCKYFFKGQCTWGSHCRFMHPGSIDKGNYNMFEGMQKAGSQPEKNPPQQRPPPRTRTPPPVGPPVQLQVRLTMPPPPMEFFPPLPEPPRRETMWERGLRTAKHLAIAAARKRDALEDKMHGLGDKFDPDFDNALFPEDEFPFNEQRNFPAFPVRHDFDPIQRDRRNNNNNNNNNNNMNNFGRFDRRRSPPVDLRKNLNDRGGPNQRHRAPDEWQDPWMRSQPARKRESRWQKKSQSPRSRSRTRSRSATRSVNKKSHASRSQSKEKTQHRTTSPKRAVAHRSPSGSPISSTRTSCSKSLVSVQLAPRRESAEASSHGTNGRGRQQQENTRVSVQEDKPPKRHHSNRSPSLSSVSSQEDGPRTPPPDEPDDSMPEDEPGSSPERPTVTGRRPHSPSPISPENERDFGDNDGSPLEMLSPETPIRKKQKKTHKPIKLTLQTKIASRALSAFDANEEDDINEEDASIQPEILAKQKLAASLSADLDRSSPLSDDDGGSLKMKGQNLTGAPDDKQNKREELLRQLRAVEEAIAKKKAIKND